MNSKDTRPSLAVGAPSALMIFVVLLLTCFGMLAFASARADAALSRRTAQSVADYYQADAAAQQALMVAEGVLAQPQAQQDMLMALSKALEGTTEVTQQDEGFRMEFPYGRYQALEVVFVPQEDGYQLVSYRTVVIGEPEYGEENYHLWEGAG